MTATLSENVVQKKNTVKLTAAQAVIRFLSNQHVEMFDGSFSPLFGGVFGIFGHGNVAGIGEALWHDRSAIPYYRGQNEQGMAHAAIAFAKAHRCRRAMAVTTSIGPGATNMVTAAALAHINRLPVLFLPGDNFASRRPDPVLQQLENERSPLASVNDCFKPVSRYFDRITRPEQLIDSLPQAVRTMLDPRTRGPVTLAFPQDTQTEAFEYPNSLFEEQKHYIHRLRPDLSELQRCVEMIKKSKRPMMIVGGGIHYSNAEKELKAFVEKHQFPVGETQAGKGSLPWDHPLNLGGIGVTGTTAANNNAAQADLILCVGTRLTDFTTASKSIFHRPDVQIIGLNINPFDASKGRGAFLTADAQVGLEELSTGLHSFLTDDEYMEEVNRHLNLWLEFHKDITKPDENTLPTDAQVLSAVNQQIETKDIVLCAAGGLPGELHKHWQATDPIGYHVEYGYSCMGYEIAGGLGAKMAHPNREVYVLVGDGSYLMMHTELLTSLHLGLKLNIILLDNHGFGCIHRLQQGCGSEPFGNLFDDHHVDFVANARSYGCHAEKVNTIKSLQKAIKKNLKRKETCITVIETTPHQGTPPAAWWDVAIAETSQEERVQEARVNYEQTLGELFW